MPKCGVLIVDDFRPFRQYLRETLQQKADLEILGEASDGLDAVRQVLRLQPDLVLLDLGLPTLNGIAVARRLRDLAPHTKILFISAERSTEVVQEALRSGDGYVDKFDCATELVPAIETVMRGERFLSSGLTLSLAATFHDDRFTGQQQLPKHRINVNHEAAFYPNDSAFVSGMTRFIEASLYAGSIVIVVVTEPHRNRIVEKLQSGGLNVSASIQDGNYVSVDSVDTLSLFMAEGWPDTIRFSKVVGDLMKATAKSAKEQGRGVVACGELAPILWAEGKRNAAIQIEHLWDAIARAHGVDTLCGYVSPTLHRDKTLREFNSICTAHTAVFFR